MNIFHEFVPVLKQKPVKDMNKHSRALNKHYPPPPKKKKTPKNDKIWLFGILLIFVSPKQKQLGEFYLFLFPTQNVVTHIFDSTSDKLFPASISLRNAFFASQEEKIF